MGKTAYTEGGKQKTWKVNPDGSIVPGSERIIWKPAKYTITFLNHYKDDETVRKVVVHEFSHLYLYSVDIDNHDDHDDNFYFKMDQFEDWLDKKWNLSPRRYKGNDWYQHVDPNKRKQRENQYPTSEQDELKYLESLLDNSKTLTELENNWQKVKSNFLYDSNKRTVRGFNNAHELPDEDNKTRLDKWYNNCKSHFKSSNNPQPNSSRCDECQKPINGNTYYSKSNQVICKECYYIERE